jgi:hypothetical protein
MSCLQKNIAELYDLNSIGISWPFLYGIICVPLLFPWANNFFGMVSKTIPIKRSMKYLVPVHYGGKLFPFF